MSVTLLTSHGPMSWLNTDAPMNMELYADTQHTEGGREEGHSVRSRYTAVVWDSSSEWVMC